MAAYQGDKDTWCAGSPGTFSPTWPCLMNPMREKRQFSRGGMRMAIWDLSKATQRGQMPPPAQVSLKLLV